MDPVSLTQKLYEAFGRGDLATLFAGMAPDIVWTSNGDPALLPWGGRREGQAAVRGFFDPLIEHIDFQVFEPREFFAGPDFVTVIGFTRGVMRKTGKPWVSEWLHLFKYREDGKVILFREFYDTNAQLDAFGRKA